MKEQYDKICPLLIGDGTNPKCRGSQCAFANIKHKAVPDEDGKLQFEKDGWYCLVRDFLMSMANAGRE